MNLYGFQNDILNKTAGANKVAYYLDMGLGKTYVGAEKAMRLKERHTLVVCQKSKVADWVEHFIAHYDVNVFNLTIEPQIDDFMNKCGVGIINYDLIYRRPKLAKLQDFTLVLDESSLIQHLTTRRTKFILKMKPKNVILLSGTPISGRYEHLLSQMWLLGWNISKQEYYNRYIITRDIEVNRSGVKIPLVIGYKNVEELKNKMREHNCVFMKTSEAIDLPRQIYSTIRVEYTPEYMQFKKNRIVNIEGRELVGDTTLTAMMYERMLCGQYNKAKLEALSDFLDDAKDRVVIFYNFVEEKERIANIVRQKKRPMSFVDGKDKDLTNYNERYDAITLVQYQSGAMGLNLQKANKILYFTPPVSCELWQQSKKRIHRVGQERPCFYYRLFCKGSIEEKIYKALQKGVDYTERLFENERESV